MLYTDRKTMIVLNDTTKEVIFKTLGPLVEKWSGGVKLNPTSVYGIRRYTNNSWMLGHVDKAESHIISVILNVAQDVDEDWPLYIKDHRGRGRQVLLQPGEMIYYESARLVHYIYIRGLILQQHLIFTLQHCPAW